jgi:hypothetical protein
MLCTHHLKTIHTIQEASMPRMAPLLPTPTVVGRNTQLQRQRQVGRDRDRKQYIDVMEKEIESK